MQIREVTNYQYCTGIESNKIVAANIDLDQVLQDWKRKYCYGKYWWVVVQLFKVNLSTNTAQTFHNTFVLVNGIALFVTLQYINSHTNLFLKMEKVICSLGQCTFGIYLLHIFIKDELGLTKWMEDMLQGKIPNMLYAFLHCGAIFICGYAITFIIKKIPFLRRLV